MTIDLGVKNNIPVCIHGSFWRTCGAGCIDDADGVPRVDLYVNGVLGVVKKVIIGDYGNSYLMDLLAFQVSKDNDLFQLL